MEAQADKIGILDAVSGASFGRMVGFKPRTTSPEAMVATRGMVDIANGFGPQIANSSTCELCEFAWSLMELCGFTPCICLLTAWRRLRSRLFLDQ